MESSARRYRRSKIAVASDDERGAAIGNKRRCIRKVSVLEPSRPMIGLLKVYPPRKCLSEVRCDPITCFARDDGDSTAGTELEESPVDVRDVHVASRIDDDSGTGRPRAARESTIKLVITT